MEEHRGRPSGEEGAATRHSPPSLPEADQIPHHQGDPSRHDNPAAGAVDDASAIDITRKRKRPAQDRAIDDPRDGGEEGASTGYHLQAQDHVGMRMNEVKMEEEPKKKRSASLEGSSSGDAEAQPPHRDDPRPTPPSAAEPRQATPPAVWIPTAVPDDDGGGGPSPALVQLLSQAVAAVGSRLSVPTLPLAPSPYPPASSASSTSSYSTSSASASLLPLLRPAPAASVPMSFAATPAWMVKSKKRSTAVPAAAATRGKAAKSTFHMLLPSRTGPIAASSSSSSSSSSASSVFGSLAAPTVTVRPAQRSGSSGSLSTSPAHLIKNIINATHSPSGAMAAATSGQYLPQHRVQHQQLSAQHQAGQNSRPPTPPPQSQPPAQQQQPRPLTSPLAMAQHIVNLQHSSNGDASSSSRTSAPSSSSTLSAASSNTASASPSSTGGLGGNSLLLAPAPVWAQRMAERRAMLANHLNEGYTRVVEYVEAMMIELEGEKEAAIRLIALERAKLEEERRQWEEEETRISSLHRLSSNKVRLNIGGQIFETTMSTLMKDPDHLFARVFSGRHEVARDEHDAVFFDRDPTVFGLVLNYLRNNELCVTPREESTLWKVLEEAKFYNIQSLIDCVKDKLGMRYVWHADWSQVCSSTDKFFQSPIFLVGGWPWRLSLVRDEGWLGISLTVSKRARVLPKGWRMSASFAVDIKQTNTKKFCASMQHSDAQLDEARTGIFWRHCYELENLVTDGVIAEDKLTISAEIKIESCTLLD